ncbi:S1 family peptidase [Veronia nyctiphanis]|nr:trypsin-like serine protease [Veronia nyctiphanis]
MKPRISGGQNASSTVPSAVKVAVLATDSSLEIDSVLCQGTLISKRHILTSGFCGKLLVDGYDGDADVIVGISNFNTQQGQRINVDKIDIHPDFVTAELTRNNLAILTLKNSVNSSPISMMSESETNSLAQSDSLTTVGWGLKQLPQSQQPLSAGRPENLQKASLRIVNGDCSPTFFYLGGLTNYHLCTQSTTSSLQGVCSGDGGSPLIRTSGGQIKLVGINGDDVAVFPP